VILTDAKRFLKIGDRISENIRPKPFYGAAFEIQ